MSLLCQRSLPAERQRGLIFVEKFRSSDEVFANGGAIGGGTPTFGPGYAVFDGASYLNYPLGNPVVRGSHACSIDVEVTPTSAAGTQYVATIGPTGFVAGSDIGVAIMGGTWNIFVGGGAVDSGIAVVPGRKTRICGTYAGGGGGTLRTYVDGVAGGTLGVTLAIVPSTIYMGGYGALSYFTGLIHSVRAFDQQLSLEEVLAYYDGSMFQYRNKHSIFLPMRAIDHDPANTRTLDRSGYGRHGVFGAGAAAPTKLPARHGYDLDGADYFTTTLGGAFNTPEISFAVEFEADYAYDGGANSFLWDTAFGTRYYCYKDAAGNIRFAANGGAIFGWTAATTAVHWRRLGSMVIVASFKSGKNNVWFNGIRLLTDDATAWGVANPATLYLGCAYDTLNNHDGRITRFASWPFALNPMQAMDLQIQWLLKASEV